METKEWIENVRNVLNEPFSQHLYDDSKETENIDELNGLLNNAKTLLRSYIHDYNYFITESNLLTPDTRENN